MAEAPTPSKNLTPTKLALAVLAAVAGVGGAADAAGYQLDPNVIALLKGLGGGSVALIAYLHLIWYPLVVGMSGAVTALATAVANLAADVKQLKAALLPASSAAVEAEPPATPAPASNVARPRIVPLRVATADTGDDS